MNNILTNLPAAALITSGVAISLFLFNLIKDCHVKRKVNKKETMALKRILRSANEKNMRTLSFILKYLQCNINGEVCNCDFINDNEYYLSFNDIEKDGAKVRQFALNIQCDVYERWLFDCARINIELFEKLTKVYDRAVIDNINIPHHMKLLGLGDKIPDKDKPLVTTDRLEIFKELLLKSLEAIDALDSLCKKK